MSKQLRIYRDSVAMEAINTADVTAYFKGIFPAVAESFQSFVHNIRPSDQALALAPSHRDFLKAIPRHAYTDVAALTAFQPEGLAVPYLEYAEVMLQAAEHCNAIMDTLNPYSVYLAQLITNPEMKLSTNSNDKEFKLLEQDRDKLNRELGACYKKGSTKAETSYGAVIQRNADWPDIFARLEAITRNINGVDRKVLLKKIGECSDHLEVIIKKINGGEMEGVANQTVMNLSNGAYQIASELEFFSVVYYKSEVLLASVQKTLDHFKKCTGDGK